VIRALCPEILDQLARVAHYFLRRGTKNQRTRTIGKALSDRRLAGEN